MTLEDLKTFVAVADCNSFSAAARRLGCSQPAVSQHVQRLERELGLRLLERKTRGVVVTRAGELLLRAATDSLTVLERARERLEALRGGSDGSLVVTTGGTTVNHFMRGAITQLHTAFPRVRMQLRAAMTSAECIEMLLREPVDLAFVTLGADVEGVLRHPVLELDYMLLSPRSHALSKRRTLRVEQLHGLEQIGLVDGTTFQGQLSASLARAGVQLQTTMTVCDWDTAITLVELGLGCAIVPSWHAHASAARAGVRATPIAGLEPIRVGWAVREGHELLPPASALMRLLREDLARQPTRAGVRLIAASVPRAARQARS